MIQVETTEDAVRVTIPRGEVDERDLSRMLDWLKLASFSRRSQMTEEEADAIAEEGKTEWWAKNKRRFIPPEEP